MVPRGKPSYKLSAGRFRLVVAIVLLATLFVVAKLSGHPNKFVVLTHSSSLFTFSRTPADQVF